MTDSYSARDAAKVLGRSERLVRKLVADGRLEVTQDKPLRVSQESVHRERSSRKPLPPKGNQAAALDAEQLSEIIKRATEAGVLAGLEQANRQLESRDRAEQMLKDSLAEARAEIEQLRQDLEAERSQPALRLPPLGWPFRR